MGPVVPLLVANALFACGLFVHGFLFNFYLKELGASTEVMGHQAAALTVGGMLALLPTGAIVDRAGARAALISAALVSGVALTASAFASTPGVIYATAIVAGAATSCWRVATAPVLMRAVDPELRARALSWNVAVLVATGGAWTAGAGALAALGEGTFGFSALASLRWALIIGAMGTLSSALLFSRVALRRQLPPTLDARPVIGRSARFTFLHGVPAWVLIAVPLIAFWMTGTGLVGPFLNIFFQQVFTLPVDRVGFIFGAGQWVAALGVAASGEAAHRLGPGRVLAVWLLLLAPALWLLATVQALAAAIAIYLVFGVIAPASFPLVDQVLLEHVPSERYGIISGFRNFATEASGALGASVGGVLLRSLGFSALFGLAGGVSIVSAAGLLVLLTLRRRVPNVRSLASAE